MTILQIINQYDSLKKALKYIIENNKSNNAPYHNLNHMLTVTKCCYKAFEYEMKSNDFYLEPFLMAAMFHDYNHSMGKKSDNINVNVAKKALANFIIESRMDLNIDFMKSVLDATQYPYVIDSFNLNLYQSIIRDADLMQIYEPNWLQQVVFGLSKEMNIPVKEMIFGQRKFLEAIEPLTAYGKYMHDKYFTDVMKELEILENIMK